MQLHVTYGKSLISNECFSKGNILRNNFGAQICKILPMKVPNADFDIEVRFWTLLH